MAATAALATMKVAQVSNFGADLPIIEHAIPKLIPRQMCLKVQIWVLGAIMLSFLSMSFPAFAQVSDSHSGFPNAPLPSAPPVNSYLQTNDHSLTFEERADLYRQSVFSLESIIGPAYGAGIGQWEDEPPGWGQGGEGYGKRFASGLGRHVISETIKFGVAAADGEDPRYFRSEDRSAWGRVKHAVVSTVVSKTSSGGTIPAYSRFAGTYGAAFIANTWYPENRATVGRAFRRGSTALASSIGFNLLREFTPFFWRGRY